MSNRSLFSIALFFCMSHSAFAEEPAPVTDKVTTEQVVEKNVPVDATKTVEATTTTTIPDDAPAEQDLTTTEQGETKADTDLTEDTPENTETLEKAPEAKAEKPPEPKKAIQKEDPSPDSAHAAGTFTVEQMWGQSSGPVKIVLGTLLFMLVVAIGVGFERLVTLTTAKSQSK
jgi:outer membrane biosynthesis protein TonB